MEKDGDVVRIGTELELVPEIILPEQVQAGSRKDSFLSGEKSLMLAVLEDGIRCFQGCKTHPHVKPKHSAKEAEAWVQAVDYEWPYSFVNVCETLGIDPDALRAKLLTWKIRHLAETTTEQQGIERKGKVYRLHLRTVKHGGKVSARQ